MQVKEQMKNLGICVIVPTYNNSGTLQSVIDSCLEWTPFLVIVNDGSTDNTGHLLSFYADNEAVEVVGYSQNKGKGHALRVGFAYARSKGFRYAITIDADGQHFASDIPVFVKAIMDTPDALVIGSRDITAKTCLWAILLRISFPISGSRYRHVSRFPILRLDIDYTPLSRWGPCGGLPLVMRLNWRCWFLPHGMALNWYRCPSMSIILQLVNG